MHEFDNHKFKPGEVYTFDEINSANLSDIPSMNVMKDGKWYPVQMSHITKEEMTAACDAWHDTKWVYEQTTREWIPVFRLATKTADYKLEDFVDVSREFDKTYDEWTYWVTPKGCPREYSC